METTVVRKSNEQGRHSVNKSKRIRNVSQQCIIITTIICVTSFFQLSDAAHVAGYNRNNAHRKLMKCTQKYPGRTHTDYDTFDMFAEIVAGVHGSMKNTSGYRSNMDYSRMIKVFVVPFTHLDAGWLKTFTEYCSETNAALNHMVRFLATHPKMRFSWCEMSFFEHWWSTANQSTKGLVRKFIQNGQLEIVSGGWVMSDEATPYFPSTIENIIEGQQFAYHELGAEPRVMFSNDPFGHTPLFPYLFTKTNIRRAVINRIHIALRLYMREKSLTKFHWRQHFDKQGKSDVYIHLLKNQHYDILNTCGPNPAICCQFDFRRLTDFQCPQLLPQAITRRNIRKKAMMLAKQFSLTNEPVVLAMWGDDFRYTVLREWYQQYDNLMALFNYINISPLNMKVQFATYSDYFNALEDYNQENRRSPATFTGDFFPYEQPFGDVWTGFYTTRPFHKRQERELHALIRAADLLSSIAIRHLRRNERRMIEKHLTAARRVLCIFQHHDAITGTAKNYVAQDYSKAMYKALKEAEYVLRFSAHVISHQERLHIDNIPLSYDRISAKKYVIVDRGRSILVYNSLPYARTELIQLHVSSAEITVFGSNGKPVWAQIEPYFDFSENKLKKYLLVFYASLKPLTLEHYMIRKHPSPFTKKATIMVDHSAQILPIERFSDLYPIKRVSSREYVLQTSQIIALLGSNSGTLQRIILHSGDTSKVQVKTRQRFDFYNDSNGAYLLSIAKNKLQNFSLVNNSDNFIIVGPLRQTAYTLSEFVQQSIWLNNIPGEEGNRLHMQLRVDIRRLQNVEFVTQFTTDMNPAKTQFYTDSIGLQLMKRGRYFNGTDLPNDYYPMPTALVLEDDMRRLSVLSNLPHGVRFTENIGFEILLDRRMSRDDGKGLGEFPTDNIPIMMGFTFVLDEMISGKQQQHEDTHYAYNTLGAHLALQSLIYQPIVFIASDTIRKISLPQNTQPFPCDIHLISIRPIAVDPDSRLLIMHRAGIDCSSANAPECEAVDLDVAVKSYLEIINARTSQKTTLSGTRRIDKERSFIHERFSLKPMDFATYLIKLHDAFLTVE